VALRIRQAHHPAVVLLIGALAAAAILAGCGGDDPGSDATSAEKPARDEQPEPILDDNANVVLIGDSLATVVPPTYADLLPQAAAERGARGVTTSNLAEPGTTTEDWLPGTPLFEERLRPALTDAEVVLVSVGGNDLQEALGGGDGIGASAGAVDQAEAAFDAVDRSGRNLSRTFEAIRRESPDTAIAYVGYPDYSSSGVWQEQIGFTRSLALGTGLSALREAAEGAGPDALIDMTTATGDYEDGVDPLLADIEYLSPEGHEFYAEEIASELTAPPAG
jgi:lysophospholipase L1-like esterase